jgi:predicted transposase YbfD/YdcC
MFSFFENNRASHSVLKKEYFEQGHGRLVTRTVRVCNDLSLIQGNFSAWEALKSVIEVSSRTLREGELTFDNRYFISTRPWKNVQAIAKIIQEHWHIENKSHYVLDVSCREDHAHIKNQSIAFNLAILRRAALNIINKYKNNESSAIKQLKAATNTDFFEKICS